MATDGTFCSKASLLTARTRPTHEMESGIQTVGTSSSDGVATGRAATLMKAPAPARTARAFATSAAGTDLTCTRTHSSLTLGLVLTQRVAASRTDG